MVVSNGRLLKPDQFAEYLGIAIWLCSMSNEHKDRRITTIDQDILPPILLKQFRVIRDQKLPIAFLTWARVSEGIAQKLKRSEPMDLKDWKSGDKLVVVDCVAPFGHKERIVSEFLESFREGSESHVSK